MSKVLFFNIAAHGHTYPTLPLVTELVRRGEEVLYYSTGSTFQSAIECTGATFRNNATPLLNDETQIDESMIKVALMLLQVTETSLLSLLPEVRAEKPDYIISDGLAPWGKYMAQLLGVPSISSMTTFATPPFTLRNVVRLISSPATSKLLLLSTPLRQVARTMYEGRADIPRFSALSRYLHKTYGLPRIQMLDIFANRGRLNLVYTSRQFQPFTNMLDDTFKFVGPSIVPRSEPVSFPFAALHEAPIIYISLGTVFNDKSDFYRLCLDAFADSGHQVVLSVGKRTHIAALGPIPRNCIVQDFVPQLELLQRADLFISHGGMNSVSEALYYGVPLIVIPQTADQHLVSEHIAQLGAGKVLRRTSITAKKLRQTAEEILAQPSYSQASARMGKSFGQADGYVRAVDEILAFKRLQGRE